MIEDGAGYCRLGRFFQYKTNSWSLPDRLFASSRGTGTLGTPGDGRSPHPSSRAFERRIAGRPRPGRDRSDDCPPAVGLAIQQIGGRQNEQIKASSSTIAPSPLVTKICHTRLDAPHRIGRVLLLNKEVADSTSHCSIDDCTEINFPAPDFGTGTISRQVLQMYQAKLRFIRP
jgi:hypothetical protein